MHYGLNILSLTLFLAGCSSSDKINSEYQSIDSIPYQVNNESLNDAKISNLMNDYIKVGCESGVYIRLDSVNVLRIKLSLDDTLNKSRFVDFNDTNCFSELIVWQNNESNLDNICSDIKLLKKHKDRKKIYKSRLGKIKFIQKPYTTIYGLNTIKVSVFINELIFMNNKKYAFFTIKNLEIHDIIIIKSG